MWTRIAGIILRYRVVILVVIFGLTAFFGYKAKDVRMSYTYAQMLPESDKAHLDHARFKEVFGEEANVYAIGVRDSSLFQAPTFNAYLRLVRTIAAQEGVSGAMSIGEAVNIRKVEEAKRFEIRRIFPDSVETQEQLDTLLAEFRSLHFYDGLIYNDTSRVYLIAVTLDSATLNTRDRMGIVDNITAIAEQFAAEHDVRFHYSGMPYIRTELSKTIKDDIGIFIGIALLITAIILFLFFRSLKAVGFSLLVVGMAVVWSFGLLALFDYEITILSGMIPPLLIIIGIPNCVFMLNKYHAEYKKHGNKIRSLQRVISKIGNAIFFTNLTTAIGFATFILTSSRILIEFGVIASINIMGIFLIAITLIPIIFSFFPPPKHRHLRHLDKKWTSSILGRIERVALNHRSKVYWIVAGCMLFAVYGITRIHTTGYMVDDLTEDNIIYKDLKFFESQFNGVMPLEIMVDTRERNGALKSETLRKLGALQDSLTKYPELSRTYSLAEASKFLRQAYYNGEPKRYRIPAERERSEIARYLNFEGADQRLLTNYVDTSFRITRLSGKMRDLSTSEMKEVTAKIRADVDAIFPPDRYDTMLTGTSIVNSQGTDYLIRNLFTSLSIAIVCIALIMCYMFYSLKMVVISLIPNIIPQLLTAALMGYLGIPIKPSTILIFSIALGIAVDDTIHFLAKYRQELKVLGGNIRKAVVVALRETGMSMIYTSIVLFFGFLLFSASEFGGIRALGLLVSLTLFFAMFSNLVLLPSLLLTFENSIATKGFRKSNVELY